MNSLRQGLRRSDLLVRWGGEEFIALLPDTPSENVPALLQRLREKGFGLRPDGQPLTASIGIADSHEAGIESWKQVIELADQRMYQAKSAGRDRVVSAQATVSLTPAAEAQRAEGT